MSGPGDHRPGDEEDFQLTIEVPRDIRHDRHRLRAWLDKLSNDLLNAEEITFDQDSDEMDAGTTEGLKVMMTVRPCGGRFPEKLTGPVDPGGPVQSGDAPG
jgi:hypothetical protein